ncbi:hypothetical protein M3Y97_01082900 [Aphelenchoides bicaudatus]|nr:hypothetical protein M3Y97_01082900 [Aphelenchoides bicaudatus]
MMKEEENVPEMEELPKDTKVLIESSIKPKSEKVLMKVTELIKLAKSKKLKKDVVIEKFGWFVIAINLLALILIGLAYFLFPGKVYVENIPLISFPDSKHADTFDLCVLSGMVFVAAMVILAMLFASVCAAEKWNKPYLYWIPTIYSASSLFYFVITGGYFWFYFPIVCNFYAFASTFCLGTSMFIFAGDYLIVVIMLNKKRLELIEDIEMKNAIQKETVKSINFIN